MTNEEGQSSVPIQRNPRQSSTSKRRTNGRACLTCHQRKVRCDILARGSPCSNCQAQNRPHCRIYEKKLRPRSARNTRQTIPIQPRPTQQSRHRQRHVGASPDSFVETDGAGENAVYFRASQAEGSPSTADGQFGAQEALYSGGQDSESESVASGNSESLDERATRNLLDLVDSRAAITTEIGSNHRLYFLGTELSNIHHLVRQRSKNVDLDQFHFGSSIPIRKFSPVPAEARELPEKSLADELIRAYFTRINPGWPIVDEVDFMNRYKSQSVPLPLLHSVFLVGAHVLASQHNDYKSLKSRCFRRAKLLIDSRFEEDRVLYIQVALLLSWNCDNLEDIISNSWYWIGFATRTAFGLGMHRDSSKSGMSDMYKRTWVRLWWVLFQFDVLVSVAYGRPQAIRLDESDTPTLQECHFEGIPNAKVAFVIEHTRLCVIFSNSMRHILALRSTLTEKAEARRQADESLAQFITHLPECLQLPQPQADIWQSFLHLTYNNFLILLHRPPALPNLEPQSPDILSDLNICGDAVVVITSIFESIRARSAMGELPHQSVYTLFTALVHISSELTSANPLVVAKSKRMLDSLLLSLREFAYLWIYARSLLRLFEWDSRRGYQRRKSKKPSTADLGDNQKDGTYRNAHGSSSRLDPANMPSSTASDPVGAANNMIFTPSSTVSGQGSMYTGQGNLEANVGLTSETRSRESLQGLPYNEGFDSGGLGLSTGGLDMMPFPLALDFLLGTSDDFDCL